MNVVFVRFNGYGKEYIYKTKLNFIVGGKYKITNDTWNNYDNKVVECTRFYRNINTVDYKGLQLDPNVLKEIIITECIDAPQPNISYKIKNIYENFDKGITTVLWSDGDKTMLNCDPWDEWDREKVIGLAFMKKHYHNRGCFNDEIRKWCSVLDSRMEKKDNETYA